MLLHRERYALTLAARCVGNALDLQSCATSEVLRRWRLSSRNMRLRGCRLKRQSERRMQL